MRVIKGGKGGGANEDGFILTTFLERDEVFD